MRTSSRTTALSSALLRSSAPKVIRNSTMPMCERDAAASRAESRSISSRSWSRKQRRTVTKSPERAARTSRPLGLFESIG